MVGLNLAGVAVDELDVEELDLVELFVFIALFGDRDLSRIDAKFTLERLDRFQTSSTMISL